MANDNLAGKEMWFKLGTLPTMAIWSTELLVLCKSTLMGNNSRWWCCLKAGIFKLGFRLGCVTKDWPLMQINDSRVNT